MFGSRRLFHVILVVAIVGLGTAAYVAVGPPASAKAPTTTATVQRGVVLSSVSATGNVSPATQLSVDFQNNGIVSEIDVSVGQHVTAGQVLAKLQSQTQTEALNVAEMNLNSAKLRLAADSSPTAATFAQDQAALNSAQVSVKSAQDSVTAAQQTAAFDATTQANAVATAQQKLNTDESNASSLQAADQQQLAADQAQLTADSAPGSTLQQTLTKDQNNQEAACGTNATLCTDDQGLVLADQAKLQETLSADNAKILADQQKIQTDGQLTTTDQTALTNAQTTQQQTAMKDQQAITSAQNQLSTAQANLASTQASNQAKETVLPSTISADQASVASSTQQMATAYTALADDTLVAPAAGTIGAINGQVGQEATGVSGSSGSSGSSSSSTGSVGAASGGFISLTNLSTLQVIAGFSETDAAKIVLGQPATVTFNALPNANLNGKVTQININSITVSNVITYNVTVSITGAPASLKPGMTANLSVVTQEKDNVLELPSSAISATGNTATVQVLQPNGKTVPATITIGMRGDTNDEITSGLKAGDKVVVSLGGRGTSLSTTARGGAGFAGLGGGAFGGAAIRVGGGG
jgi:multidrug efflux pump subunit AcrA (membrane-fusion protein)